MSGTDVVASLPDQDAGAVRAAVERLRGNQPAWEALGPTGRGQWLGRLRDWLFDNDERVAALLQQETGKPWQEAALEVPAAIDLLEYYRKRAERFLADSHPRPHSLLTASKKSASVWTRDRRRGEQIAGRLEVGAVNVNDMFVNVFAIPLPQAGWKESGVGARLGGAPGIRKSCRPQAVTATRLAPRSELLWFPYTALKSKLFLRGTRFVFAHDWSRRLGRRRR